MTVLFGILLMPLFSSPTDDAVWSVLLTSLLNSEIREFCVHCFSLCYTFT